MKGSKLIATVLKYFVICLGVLLAIFNYYNSWSDHVVDARYRPLLNAILYSTSLVFIISSLIVKEKKKVLTKVFGKEFRLEHGLRISGALFACILFFELNNFTEVAFGIRYNELHYVFTALAIISGYITMLFYADTIKHRRYSYICLGFGAITFASGLLGFYSVSWAEVLVAIPLLLFLTYIMRKK